MVSVQLQTLLPNNRLLLSLLTLIGGWRGPVQ
jgi:hypothetical protein